MYELRHGVCVCVCVCVLVCLCGEDVVLCVVLCCVVLCVRCVMWDGCGLWRMWNNTQHRSVMTT